MKTGYKKPEAIPKNLDKSLAETLNANELLHMPKLTRKRYQDLIDVKRTRSEKAAERSNLFFAIGLVVSLLFVTIMINWKSYDEAGVVSLGEVEADFDDLIEVPLSEQAPPPPPPKSLDQVNIQVVKDEVMVEDIDINFDVEMTEDMKVADVMYEDIPIEIEEEKAEEIFQIVEDQPAPVGGIEAFYQFIADNIRYPDMANRLGVTGVVYVRFVVEKDGSITDVQVLKGIGAGCDEEAVRVVSLAPAWKPGKQRGKPVRVYMTVPIRFVIVER